MKKISIIISIISIFTFCKKEDSKVCGCDEPTIELQWLQEMINKADADTTGLFRGQIYFEIIDNEELFFIMMEFDSIDGNIKHWLNCNGENVEFEFHKEPKNMKLNHLIYSNINN